MGREDPLLMENMILYLSREYETATSGEIASALDIMGYEVQRVWAARGIYLNRDAKEGRTGAARDSKLIALMSKRIVSHRRPAESEIGSARGRCGTIRP